MNRDLTPDELEALTRVTRAIKMRFDERGWKYEDVITDDRGLEDERFLGVTVDGVGISVHINVTP